MTAWVKQFIFLSASAFALTSSMGSATAMVSEITNPEATAAITFASLDSTLPELPPLGDPSLYLPASETYLVLRLGERRVYVYRGDDVLASYPVAIGTSRTPTPTGEFQVFQMIENPVWQSPWTGEIKEPGPNSALGLRWIGFAQMSNGIIGFHGTPTVSSIGQAASNGCVRMYNKDVVAMFEQVDMGTRVVVEQ
ncbi:MAG: L,D-transpeptidase [Jaaginema sp. PMC 1079.18]|nr:L,D-transpeptidase [Jaaginema sp. PMC 1080.18]MEC4851022.1 L,D-transpeptidase [Jaaginema sp. PMC 1079.18]MEC4868021.1 L,D-transpeptidase [Jaaginema sp. PMC 1078.18]